MQVCPAVLASSHPAVRSITTQVPAARPGPFDAQYRAGMASVLFRESPPVVDALIEERRRRGADRFDEVWEGVYVVNPPPSFRHSTVAGLIHDLVRPHADAAGLVVRREVGIGGADDHRIPDVVVAGIGDLDESEHYLLTAEIAIEVRSPNERIDKRPFYLAHDVPEVVVVDLATGTVTWWAIAGGGDGYQPVEASAILPIGPDDLTPALDG